jgi:hypothetical protein
MDEFHIAAIYWPDKTKEPEMVHAIGGSIQKGLAVSSGDALGPLGARFALQGSDLDLAKGREGVILAWGKIAYLDVFGVRHETGFCRAYLPEEDCFRMFNAPTLDYYT